MTFASDLKRSSQRRGRFYKTRELCADWILAGGVWLAVKVAPWIAQEAGDAELDDGEPTEGFGDRSPL